MSQPRVWSPSLILFATLSVAAVLPAYAAGASNGADWPPGLRRGVRLSAAGERLLRDEIAAGRIGNSELLRRLGLDVPELDPTLAPADALERPAGGLRVTGTTALLPDAQVNNKTGDATCAGGCASRPLGQAETTIAALGSFVLASWNDTKGFCTGGAVQGYGYSVNGGLTWTDLGDVPALPTGGRYRGDPVVTVNKKTGAFYILGLYEGGAPGSGIALARGHFAAGTFVIDDNRQIAVGGADFFDKEWMAVDSLTGNLYVSYSNFVGGSTSQIELIRSTDNGATWDPALVLNQPEDNNNVQGSRPAVGPDGEVYVVWYEYGVPQSHMRIRRSDDFGASFGPERTVTDYYENYFSGAPGFRRAFGIALPGIAVDMSAGPYRGRVYVPWDESVNFLDAPFSSATAKSEVENNGFFASATPFSVGNVLRGGMASTADVDLFRFSGLRGQTIYFMGDSASINANFQARLVCASDTSQFNNLRLLAFNQSPFPALVFTLPADGVYYLRLVAVAGTPASYRMSTTLDTPSLGERARDHRDRFMSYSDDGTAWSTPVRLNDDNPWFDGTFPEVTVDGTGAVHCYWHDFRDDPGCGAESYEYMVSSGDGGATWGPNRRVSDDRSFWSFNACGSANQGDYQGIASDGQTVYPCWADSRLGDPDVFMDAPSFAHGSGCPADQQAFEGAPVMLTFSLTNQGNVSGDFTWRVEDDYGWLVGATPSPTGNAALGPSGTQMVQATFQLPGICPGSPDRARFITGDVNIPGRLDTCVTLITCTRETGVQDQPLALALDRPRPNPASGNIQLGFTLSRPGPARLEIFGANGARVRSLIRGTRPAGTQSMVWDGRDERGRRAGAGIYYVRLEAEGRRLRQALTLIR